MRMLVTGVSGLLGANLALEFSRAGMQVTGVSRRHPVRLSGIETVTWDLERSSTAGRLITMKPDWIINCAAATDVDWCEAHPAESARVNAELPAQLAAA